MKPDSIYDITDIPAFAFVPGLNAWAALFVLALLLWFLWFVVKHSQNSRKAEFNALNALSRELRRLTSSPSFGEPEVNLLSRLIRNYLSLNQKLDINSFTESELRALGERSTGPLKEILSRLGTLESVRYNPKTREELRPELFTHFSSLILELSQQGKSA